MAPRTKISDLLTTDQAAKILGTTRQAVSLAIARKRLKSHKFGRVRLIPRASLEQYKKTRKSGRPKKKKTRK